MKPSPTTLPRPVRAAASLAALLVLSACSTRNIPFLGGNQQQASAPTASTERVTVEEGDIEDRVIGTGKIVARKTTDVPFAQAGTIVEVSVKVGDSVKKGQPLARIDDTSLKNAVRQQQLNVLAALAAHSQTIAGPSAADVVAAEAALRSANAAYADLGRPPSQAEIAAVQASLQNAEASLRSAQAAYDRRAARDPGISASSEALALEKATNDYNLAKANYDAKFEKKTTAQYASASAAIANAKKSLAALQPAATSVETARIKVEQARLTLELAEAELPNAVLLSPVDGLVTGVNIDVGESAGGAAAAVQIVDFAEPVFEVNLDEVDLSSVKLGQEARLRLQTYPDQPIKAVVSEIALAGTASGNVTTYLVRLTVPRTEGQPMILLSMSGTAEIITSRIAKAVLVPSGALIVNTQSKTYSVLKVNGDAVDTIQVEIGAKSSDKTQILKGIAVGDVLAIPAVRVQTSAAGPGGGGGGGGGRP